jgi:hypothetical protein
MIITSVLNIKSLLIIYFFISYTKKLSSFEMNPNFYQLIECLMTEINVKQVFCRLEKSHDF